MVFLANFARTIRVLIRCEDLHASMSRYLIDRISSLPNVTLCTRCTLSALEANEAALTHVRVQLEAGVETIEARHLFLFAVGDVRAESA